MTRNNTVFLLIGQRGAGKSEYAKKIVEQQPGVSIVSRDEVLLRIFGSVHSSPHSGEPEYGGMITRRLLRRKLSTQTGLKLILDYWTGSGHERRFINKWLRAHGATKVIALYFMTSLELVNEWFWKKPGVAKTKEAKLRQNEGLIFFSESCPSCDYKSFHKLALQIDSDGFDEVIKINPEEPIIIL